MVVGRYEHTATLLPSAVVLVVGGRNDTVDSLPSAEVYDPTMGTWSATPEMASPRRAHAATLLPSGKILVAGGYDDGDFAASELFDEGRGAEPAWTPTISGPRPAVLPGEDLSLAGTLFTGVSEAAGGLQSSATNHPLVLLWREDSEALAFAPVTGFDATGATATVPATVLPGPYLIWVVVNGVLSGGQPLSVVLPTGAPCGTSSVCSSGACVDGVCCAGDCTGPCMSCAVAGLEGACSPIPAGVDPDGDCAGEDVCGGTCDGAGACDDPGPETPCADSTPDDCQEARCDGSGACGQPGAVRAAGTACNTSSLHACLLGDVCAGLHGACPTHYVLAGTECRPSAGDCDPAEVCNGTSADCPADTRYNSAHVCHPSIGACDPAETCDGTSALCPANLLSPRRRSVARRPTPVIPPKPARAPQRRAHPTRTRACPTTPAQVTRGRSMAPTPAPAAQPVPVDAAPGPRPGPGVSSSSQSASPCSCGSGAGRRPPRIPTSRSHRRVQAMPSTREGREAPPRRPPGPADE